MSDKTWAVGTSGDWSNAANWDPGGVPVSGDKVLLPSRTNVAITTGLSQGAVDLDLLFVEDGYTKDIATSSTALTISADKIIHRGKGTLYLAKGTAAIDEIVVAHTGSNQNLALSYTGGGTAKLIASKGRISIPTLGDTIGELIIVDADMTVAGADATITTIWQAGGTLTIGEGINLATAIVSAGVLNAGGDGYEGAGVILHMSGGIVNWDGLSTDLEAPILDIGNILGGLLNLTRNSLSKTIRTLNLWPDGTIRYFPDRTTFINPIYEFDGRSVAP